MRKLLSLSLFLTLFAFLLPMMATRGGAEKGSMGVKEGAVEVVAPADKIGEDPPLKQNATEYLSDSDIMVRVEMDSGVYEMEIGYYLLSVVAAEMPADFSVEALKAQAVAARTHTYYRILEARSGMGAHANADVCTKPGHCKAYLDWDEISSEWDRTGKNYTQKVLDAVQKTSGEMVLYDNEPIVAVFHAASAEYTERAEDVWGSAVPYLQSVKSPVGETYSREKRVTKLEFTEKIVHEYPSVSLGENPNTWCGEAIRSEAGGVRSIEIGGITLTGSSVRFLFDLPSTNFEIVVVGDDIVFYTEGYGHGVGMSQYGAEALAREGKTYIDILKWYYSGVTVTKIPQN